MNTSFEIDRNILGDFIFQFDWNIIFENYNISSLYEGSYFIIKKGDSITIHNWELTAPIFSEKNIAIIDYGDKFVLIKKKTKKVVKIYIYKSIFFHELKNLSKNKPSKTLEKDIRNTLAKNLEKIDKDLKLVQMEYEIKYGLIDILAQKNWIYYIFELKKDKTNFNAISQVLRYKEYIEDTLKKECICYVVWYWITEDSKKFAEENRVNVINLDTINLLD